MRSGPHSIGSHPARPQSGVADGARARARNRPARWHDSLRIRQPKGQVPRLNPQAVIPNPPSPIALQTRIEPAHRLSRNGTVTRAIEHQHRMAEQEQEHDNKPEQYHAPKWPVDGAGRWISFGGHCISYGGHWVMVADRTAWDYQR